MTFYLLFAHCFLPHQLVYQWVCLCLYEPQHHSVQSLEDFPLHHHIPRPSRVLHCQPMDLPKFLFYTIPKVRLCADNQRSSLFNFCLHRVLWCSKWCIYLYIHILEEILMHKKHTLWLFNLLILILDTSETTSVFLPWPWSRLAGDEGEPLWYPWGSAKCPVW